MTPQETLARAIALASEAHKYQFDKGGNPYILHCLEVMRKIRNRYPDDLELQAIAVLHDAIEDTELDVEDLTNMGYSDRVVGVVNYLTKYPDESYVGYIEALIRDEDAIKVKLADIEHNSDITRLKGLRDKDFKRMEKYHNTYVMLKEKLKEYGNV